MSTHKNIDRICCLVMVLALALTVLFMNGESFGVQAASSAPGYETRLFDTSTVHTIDIVMDDWEGFLETCTNEEYTLCSVVIDNEAYKNVAIRAKGNTSLTQVAQYGNDRYSFKIEFDHYDSTKSYYGLDKLSLNNIIQDNTYMKDYLTYQMMGYFGVDAPLCSYVYITVNGEDWGLYLAVEGVEEAFLERNYGNDYGELYKPDSQSMGGGRGNGGAFDMEDWTQERSQEEDSQSVAQEEVTSDVQEDAQDGSSSFAPGDGELPQDLPERGFGGRGGFQMDGQLPEGDFTEGEIPSGDFGGKGGMGGGMGGSMGSDDVSLIYTDDNYDSYQNIFDNAKTDITDSDKDRLIDSLQQLNDQENLEEVVDVDEVIRYFVVHNFVCNFDSYTGSMIHNYYLYEEDGQLSMIPWDYNLAFGGFQGAQDATALVNYPIDTPVSGGTVDSRPMLSWIFSDETYTQMYHQYFQEFLTQYFDSGYFVQEMDRVTALIAPYVEQDPTKFCTYEEFETGIETLREFCLLRAESIQGQLDGTIPSTSDGQSEDSSALIDASSLNITDMGSMNGNMGGGMGGMERPEDMELPQGMEPPGDTALPEDMELPEGTEESSQSQEDSSASEETVEEESSQASQEETPPELPSGEAVPEDGQAFPQEGAPPSGMPEGGPGSGDFAEKSQNTA